MRRFAILLAVLPLAGCFHDIHELPSGRHSSAQSPYSGESLLATTLVWEMPEDAGTSIHSLTLSAGGAVTPFTKQYKDAKEAASQLIPVSPGKIDILATVNMTDSDGFSLSGMPATRADAAVGDVVVSVKDPASSPAQAWFGVTGTEVKDREITFAQAKLQRLMSSFTLNLSNVPAGTRVEITLSNVAQSVNLTAKDASGRWGLPSTDSVGPFVIAALSAASDGPLKLDGFTVLPTALAFSRCILTIDVTSAGGNKTRSVCDAPHMDVGKGYTLNLDYSALKPYMFLDTCSISLWEDGWTVNGEILNPTE